MQSHLTPELYRKIVHLGSLFIPICYALTSLQTATITFAIILSLCLLFDLLRLKVFKDSHIFLEILKKTRLAAILRPHEAHNLSGASYLFIAAVICIFFSTKEVFIIAFSILATADTAAALVGKKYGAHKIGDKSIEGSIAFFVTAVLTASLIMFAYTFAYTDINMPFVAAVIVSIISTTIAELYVNSSKFDDNLVIPTIFCLSFNFFATMIKFIL